MLKIIAVDFDGTLCVDAYPGIGEPIWKSINALLAEQRKGAKLILWTCRGGDKLQCALDWCSAHDICFDAINENLPDMIEEFGSDSRKVYAHEYWDDKAVRLPCPYKSLEDKSEYVKKREMLEIVYHMDIAASQLADLYRKQPDIYTIAKGSERANLGPKAHQVLIESYEKMILDLNTKLSNIMY